MDAVMHECKLTYPKTNWIQHLSNQTDKNVHNYQQNLLLDVFLTSGSQLVWHLDPPVLNNKSRHPNKSIYYKY